MFNWFISIFIFFERWNWFVSLLGYLQIYWSNYLFKNVNVKLGLTFFFLFRQINLWLDSHTISVVYVNKSVAVQFGLVVRQNVIWSKK